MQCLLEIWPYLYLKMSYLQFMEYDYLIVIISDASPFLFSPEKDRIEITLMWCSSDKNPTELPTALEHFIRVQSEV